jgi:hypothetical protein
MFADRHVVMPDAAAVAVHLKRHALAVFSAEAGAGNVRSRQPLRQQVNRRIDVRSSFLYFSHPDSDRDLNIHPHVRKRNGTQLP